MGPEDGPIFLKRTLLTLLLFGAPLGVIPAEAQLLPTATQKCSALKLADARVKVECEIAVLSPTITDGSKLSLKWHVRPGFDVSLPAAIPIAAKSNVSFSSADAWNCVAQGAPQAPALGCYLASNELANLTEQTVLKVSAVIDNPEHTRDVKSCFRIAGDGIDRSLSCLPLAFGMPEAELSLNKTCGTVWSDGSFLNYECSIFVAGAYLLPRTSIQLSDTVLVGEVVVPQRTLSLVSVQDWKCKTTLCMLDTGNGERREISSQLSITSRVPLPHVDEAIYSCTQVTTRTPKLAADRICIELSW